MNEWIKLPHGESTGLRENGWEPLSHEDSVEGSPPIGFFVKDVNGVAVTLEYNYDGEYLLQCNGVSSKAKSITQANAVALELAGGA